MTTTARTNWHLDILEKWTVTDLQHSIELPAYNDRQTITLERFLNDVNNALSLARDERDEMPMAFRPVYELEAELLAPDADWSTLNNFIIRYTLKQTHTSNSQNTLVDGNLGEFESFKVQFRNGPHGFNVPVFLNDEPTPRGVIHYSNYSDTRAAVLPYSTHTVAMQDKPPVPPDVQIRPYSGVSTRLLLMLNSSTGEYDARPVILRDSDVEAIALHYTSQTGISISPAQVRSRIQSLTDPLTLTYRNDDPVTKYEVFRITNRPTSYEDFNVAGNPHEVVTGRITSEKQSSSATLIDKVEPNTKYYYCVRALDVHNNSSNPTHVFEAELVDNDGQVYLILNTIIFETNISDISFKSGRRFMYIEPSLRNLNYTEPADPNATVMTPGPTGLGDGSDSCWEKTFKVRLTSRKTSKKIDLNILFKNTGVINP